MSNEIKKADGPNFVVSAELYRSIADVLEQARSKAYRAINTAMVHAYWEIGRRIVEEQGGDERAEYGKALVKELAKRLTEDYGRGFAERNLWSMRKFYLAFPKVNALRSELTWTHYRALSRVADDNPTLGIVLCTETDRDAAHYSVLNGSEQHGTDEENDE